jgi:hypothetical protein
MLNKPRKYFMQPMKVCLPWLNSYSCHTQLYARLWKYLSSYSKLVYLCVWILFVWYQKLKVSCMVIFRAEGTFKLTKEGWVGRAGPNPWPGQSCDFTLLDDVFWHYVTEHIYIQPFGILLMERHTEIEYVLRPALFGDCMQHKVVIPFWCFGITNQSLLQG